MTFSPEFWAFVIVEFPFVVFGLIFVIVMFVRKRRKRSKPFDGQIENVRTWSRGLSSEEVYKGISTGEWPER